MTMNDYRVMEYLQKKWDTVVYIDKHSTQDHYIRAIGEWTACELMARELTGKRYDVSADDTVYVAEETKEEQI